MVVLGNMRNIPLIILSFLIFVSCKKEKTGGEKTINQPEVDYRVQYENEYICKGYYRTFFDDIDSFVDYTDTFDIIYHIKKSGDSSIVIEGKTLKIATDGYFGPRYFNAKFENPPHGIFINDSTISYSKDKGYYDSTYGSYYKRLYISGIKKK